jgi:hypothetical protein
VPGKNRLLSSSSGLYIVAQISAKRQDFTTKKWPVRYMRKQLSWCHVRIPLKRRDIITYKAVNHIKIAPSLSLIDHFGVKYFLGE